MQTISDENIKNALSKRISPHCAWSCISYFSVYNNCVEFRASGLGTGLNRDPFKAETTYSHDPSLTSHLSLGLIHPCTITALSMCSSKFSKINLICKYIAYPKFYCSLDGICRKSILTCCTLLVLRIFVHFHFLVLKSKKVQ